MLPIADRHLDYAASVRDRLAAAGLRVELDERQEKIGYKIREAQLQKIPYMLVVGDREAAEGTVSVRSRARRRPGSARRSTSSSTTAQDEVARSEAASAGRGLRQPRLGASASRLIGGSYRFRPKPAA